MSQDVTLPALGESVTEGTVTRWLKNVGDTVEVDEPLLEVSTDKVDTEVPSPVAGTLQEILVQEDETAEVGAVLARIGDGAAAASGDDQGDESGASEDTKTEAEAEPETEAKATDDDDRSSESSSSERSGDADTKKSSGGNEIKLPALGESVTEGTITRWLKNVGDKVAADEAIVEVSTDKVDTEVPSPFDGVLEEILVKEDETADVGAVIAIIGEGSSSAEGPADKPAEDAHKSAPSDDKSLQDEAIDEAESKGSKAEPESESEAAAKTDEPTEKAGREPASSEPAHEAKSESAPSRTSAPDAAAQRSSTNPEPKLQAPKPPKRPSSNVDPRYVTPIVRKLAASRGVDLTQVSGTGVGGRIRKEDVLEAAERLQESQSQAAAPVAAVPDANAAPEKHEISELRGTSQKMSRLRKVIAARAVESMQQTAQLTTVVEVDVTRVAAFRQAKKAEFQEKTGSKLSFLPFFTLAAIEALQTYPVINSTVKDDEIFYPDTENISIAVDTERGLLTPVVKNASDMSLADLAKSIDDLATRTRDNKLTPDELAGGTFTVTNTGSRGALFDTPLVFLPQQAILGTGAVVKRPAVVKTEDGQESLAIRSMVYLALSYDHRIIDGADAARFLGQMKKRLETGAFEQNLGY